ncbi:CNNM domain-containing protein [Nocardioides convexus]|uniref:CNNM domain-containing protein n=1 Tax=Nocardioides convexus TaxID=2712224 RepID=UPI00241816D6|nr:CNNM domain-containing protein [Nocardioides convexus]
MAAIARDPNRFLSAVQIGVTVAGFLSAAYGGSTLAPDVAPYLVDLGLGAEAADTAALIVMTLLIAYLSLVLGELVPKRLALQRTAGVAMTTGPVLDRFATLMRPVIWLLSRSTDAVVRLLGGDPNATSEEVSTEEPAGHRHQPRGAGRRGAADPGRRVLRDPEQPQGGHAPACRRDLRARRPAAGRGGGVGRGAAVLPLPGHRRRLRRRDRLRARA